MKPKRKQLSNIKEITRIYSYIYSDNGDNNKQLKCKLMLKYHTCDMM